MPIILDVDPGLLRLPPSRFQGADPGKLARQIHQFGALIVGMPTILVTQGTNTEFMINDGVTRATRVAKFFPGTTVQIEVIDIRPKRDMSTYPFVKDRLP